MNTGSGDSLRAKKCVPCEGGVEACSLEEARKLMEQLNQWILSEDGKRISKTWKLKNFVIGLEKVNAIGQLAEQEAHHPDLHLESYRMLRVEIWTHAIGGLSENDFILAAKIDAIMN
jgi:4a-hydroxytetrahydrobiopterin dehydratase